MLLKGFITELMVPCGLHLILAHHRYLYRFLFDVINNRKQNDLIAVALREIGCGYLAFSLEVYHSSKKKHYDGSETLRMCGNDCKQIESQCDTMLNKFVRSHENWNGDSCLKLRQLLELYRNFADLARDTRSTTADIERANSFMNRAEFYFSKFMQYTGTKAVSGLPYMHYLRNHVGFLMHFYAELGWVYGMFTCNAGEHLNKRIKFSEINETNLDENRFMIVTRLTRLKQFFFTDTITPNKTEFICSACNQPGHNRKNKNCPLHPSHPTIEFEDSEDEQN